MKIAVDADLCQGHAMCEAEAPEVFRYDHHISDVVQVLQPDPPPELHDAVRRAVRYCPAMALSLSNDAPTSGQE